MKLNNFKIYHKNPLDFKRENLKDIPLKDEVIFKLGIDLFEISFQITEDGKLRYKANSGVVFHPESSNVGVITLEYKTAEVNTTEISFKNIVKEKKNKKEKE